MWLDRVNWMMDESLSNWWASFKVNSGALSTCCWLSPLSLSCCFNILSLSVSTNPFFLLFFPHDRCHLSSQSRPPSPLPRQSLVPWLSFTSSSSFLSYLWPHPAVFAPFLWPLKVSMHKSPCQCVCVSLSLSFFSLLLILSISRCLSFRQLMENKITTIERGAFQDLKELERLWVTLLCRSIRHFIP